MIPELCLFLISCISLPVTGCYSEINSLNGIAIQNLWASFVDTQQNKNRQYHYLPDDAPDCSIVLWIAALRMPEDILLLFPPVFCFQRGFIMNAADEFHMMAEFMAYHSPQNSPRFVSASH